MRCLRSVLWDSGSISSSNTTTPNPPEPPFAGRAIRKPNAGVGGLVPPQGNEDTRADGAIHYLLTY